MTKNITTDYTSDDTTLTNFFMARCEQLIPFPYAVGDFFYDWGFESPNNAAEYIQTNFVEGESYQNDEDFPEETAYIGVNRITHDLLLRSKLECVPKATEQYKKQNKSIEKGLETELEGWLIKNGIVVERQVSTKSKHRLDLWVPNMMILELKVGSINADDVCQAIDYYATYSRRLLLVGNKLTHGASRGIDGFNRVVKEESAIIFVTWSGIKPLLTSLLMIQGVIYR